MKPDEIIKNLEGKMDRMPGVFGVAVVLAVFFLGGWAGAQQQHEHGSPAAPAGKKSGAKEASTSKSTAQNLTVEGYKITFDVMSMEEHMKHLKTTQGHGEVDHSKTHSFMVTVQDTASKEIISDAKIRYVITTPGGGKETGNLTWSGDHYGGGFNAKEKGTYQAQLKVESGGMEREAIFKYAAK
jgi:hypothetical protein